MRMVVLRYRAMKPRDGHLEFVYHRDGTILGFQENWHKDNGWEVCLDILVDTEVPVERRKFFLCTGGDNLTALGESAFAYHVGTNAQKGYASYLFDVSHLADQTLAQLRADQERLYRHAPRPEELSYKAKQQKEREDRIKERERIARERKENAERQARRIANERAETDRLVASREAADAERQNIDAEGSHLRIVEEA